MPTPTGLTADTQIEVGSDGAQETSLVLSWDARAGLSTQIRYRTGVLQVELALRSWTYLDTAEARLLIPTTVGTLHEIQARHRDRRLRVGDWTDSLVYRATADTTAPAAPSAVVALALAAGYRLDWSAPDEPDYAFTEIREGDAADSAVLVGRSAQPPFNRLGIAAEDDGTYAEIDVWLFHVDRSGNRSDGTTVAVTPIHAGTAGVDARRLLPNPAAQVRYAVPYVAPIPAAADRTWLAGPLSGIPVSEFPDGLGLPAPERAGRMLTTSGTPAQWGVTTILTTLWSTWNSLSWRILMPSTPLSAFPAGLARDTELPPRVTANPGGTGLATLSTLGIGNTSYRLPSGGSGGGGGVSLPDITPTIYGRIVQVAGGATAPSYARLGDLTRGLGDSEFPAVLARASAIPPRVTANPGGTGLATLSTLGIGNTSYRLPSGGSGGGGGVSLPDITPTIYGRIVQVAGGATAPSYARLGDLTRGLGDSEFPAVLARASAIPPRVTANPGGTGLATLSTLGIGNTSYRLPSGGSGGGGGVSLPDITPTIYGRIVQVAGGATAPSYARLGDLTRGLGDSEFPAVLARASAIPPRVTANPGGTGLATLSTLGIGDTSYRLPSGGSGGVSLPAPGASNLGQFRRCRARRLRLWMGHRRPARLPAGDQPAVSRPARPAGGRRRHDAELHGRREPDPRPRRSGLSRHPGPGRLPAARGHRQPDHQRRPPR